MGRLRVDMDLVLLNLSYLLMFVGLSLRDLLGLRGCLAGAQSSFILYGVSVANVPMMLWNCLFLGMNLVQIYRHLRDRAPVDVSPDLERIHRETFRFLPIQDFMRLWSAGEPTRREHGWILEQGTAPLVLMFITSGKVEVVHGGQVICHLGPGQFLGEMEFVTGETLNVGFRPVGAVSLHVWSRQSMIRIGDQDPRMCVRIQGVLGRAVLRKLQESTPARGGGTEARPSSGGLGNEACASVTGPGT